MENWAFELPAPIEIIKRNWFDAGHVRKQKIVYGRKFEYDIEISNEDFRKQWPFVDFIWVTNGGRKKYGNGDESWFTQIYDCRFNNNKKGT